MSIPVEKTPFTRSRFTGLALTARTITSVFAALK